MTDQEEHRGWEIEDNYSQHWLDNPDYDLAEDEIEGVSWKFYAVMAMTLALAVGSVLLNSWLAPPPVVFRPPVIYVTAIGSQQATDQAPALTLNDFSIYCVEIDGYKRIIKPNWANPNCRGPR